VARDCSVRFDPSSQPIFWLIFRVCGLQDFLLLSLHCLVCGLGLKISKFYWRHQQKILRPFLLMDCSTKFLSKVWSFLTGTISLVVLQWNELLLQLLNKHKTLSWQSESQQGFLKSIRSTRLQAWISSHAFNWLTGAAFDQFVALKKLREEE
jgi:hypothetical protein